MDGTYTALVCPRFYLEVETWIVDTHHHVWTPLGDIALAEAYIAKYGAQMQSHIHEAHDGKVAYMAHRRTPDSSHSIATPKAERSIGIAGKQFAHQVGPMQVARGFTGYDIVFHCIVRVLDFSR